MTYAVLAQLQVINEQGEVVNVLGHPRMNQDRFSPLAIELKIGQKDDADTALDLLNQLFQILIQIKQLNGEN